MINRIFLFLLFALSSMVYGQDDITWVKSWGGVSHDLGSAITTDSEENIIVAGSFMGTVDFDPGIGTFYMTSDGGYDFFVQKLDKNGNFLWAISYGSLNYDYCEDLATDTEGNIYFSGSFGDTVIFDEEIDSVSMSTPTYPNYYIGKLSPEGEFLWVRSSKGISSWIGSSGKSLYVRDGFVFSLGYFSDDLNFNELAPEEIIETNGEQDIFIEKRDLDGNFVWIKNIGSVDPDFGESLTIDSYGNIWITGGFGDAMDFDPGVGVFTLSPLGSDYDLFVQKLDFDGNFLWAGRIGSTGMDVGQAIATDLQDNVFVTGFFSGSTDFKIGPGSAILTSNGLRDVFILKLNNDADYLWSKSFGGTSYDRSFDIVLDTLGNAYTIGYTSNEGIASIDFNPGPEITSETVGTPEMFIEKLDSSGNYVWHKSFEFEHIEKKFKIVKTNHEEFYVAGSHLGGDFQPDDDYDYNVASAGSIDCFVLKLGQCLIDSIVETITACDQYTWIDDSTYTESTAGVTHVLYNDLGCESILTLNLTIHPNDYTIDSISTCNSITWIDGIEYSEDNSTATFVLSNELGCDSVVQLNLEIIDIDVSIIVDDLTLTGVESDVSYQWLDCLNDFIEIPGANEISFTPETNGEYALEITKSGCVDTSNCYEILSLGLDDQFEESNIKIYPNPSNGDFLIYLADLKDVIISIYSSNGDLIYYNNKINESLHTINLEVEAGIYFLEISNSKINERHKLILY